MADVTKKASTLAEMLEAVKQANESKGENAEEEGGGGGASAVAPLFALCSLCSFRFLTLRPQSGTSGPRFPRAVLCCVML